MRTPKCPKDDDITLMVDRVVEYAIDLHNSGYDAITYLGLVSAELSLSADNLRKELYGEEID